jgi:hypothetical protein
MVKENRILKPTRNLSAAHVFFLLVTLDGVLLVAAMAPSTLSETLGLVSLAILFGFLLTLARFSEGLVWERIAFTLSFLGGYLMLIATILVISFQYPINPAGSCAFTFAGYYCWGMPITVYYLTIDVMLLSGIASVSASLLYASYHRGYLVSVPILISAACLFLTTASSIQFSPLGLLGIPAGASGLLILVRRVTKIGKLSFPEQIITVVTRRTLNVILLTVLAAGTISGLRGLSVEANNDVNNLSSDSNVSVGLRLDLRVSSTSLKLGGGIAIGISLHNLRSSPNNVSTSTNWKFQWNPGPCGNPNSPMSLGILQGYYTSDNVSTGKPLELYPPISGKVFGCGPVLVGISSFTFDPSSDHASVWGSCSPNPCFKWQMSSLDEFSGSWTTETPPPPTYSGTPGTFNPFSEGRYTVVGSDEWSDLVILHFTVS